MARGLKSRRTYTRKAGQQVPRLVADLLARRHPTVELLWEAKARRWCLVQTVRGKSMLIRILGSVGKYEPPTIANTVYYLDSIHPARLRTEAAKRKFLESMDTSKDAESVKRAAQLRIADGSKELWNQINGRKVIPIGRN